MPWKLLGLVELLLIVRHQLDDLLSCSSRGSALSSSSTLGCSNETHVGRLLAWILYAAWLASARGPHSIEALLDSPLCQCELSLLDLLRTASACGAHVGELPELRWLLGYIWLLLCRWTLHHPDFSVILLSLGTLRPRRDEVVPQRVVVIVGLLLLLHSS